MKLRRKGSGKPQEKLDFASQETPIEDEADYYLDENGLMVFTRSYHLRRGSCCESGCRHCPYGFKEKSGLRP